MDVQELDRSSLLAALEGNWSALGGVHVEPAFCQEIFPGDGNGSMVKSLLKVEGLGTIQIPVPFHVSIIVFFFKTFHRFKLKQLFCSKNLKCQ